MRTLDHALPIAGSVVVAGLLASCSSALPALHQAILARDATTVTKLLAEGANANQFVYRYGRPLSMAAGICQAQIVRELIDHGAETSGIDAEATLSFAVRVCNMATIEILLEKGVDPNANYYLGDTILMGAVRRGDMDVLQLLLAYHANPNLAGRYEKGVKAREGESYPLMLAATLGKLDIVRVLVSEGADLGARDSFGLTALSAAVRLQHEDVASFLRSRGAT